MTGRAKSDRVKIFSPAHHMPSDAEDAKASEGPHGFSLIDIQK